MGFRGLGFRFEGGFRAQGRGFQGSVFFGGGRGGVQGSESSFGDCLAVFWAQLLGLQGFRGLKFGGFGVRIPGLGFRV